MTCAAQLFAFLVPSTGFEPARLAAPPPQDGESTNFSNWAFVFCACKYTLFLWFMKLYCIYWAVL